MEEKLDKIIELLTEQNRILTASTATNNKPIVKYGADNIPDMNELRKKIGSNTNKAGHNVDVKKMIEEARAKATAPLIEAGVIDKS